jgi:alpha-tubulin suppressor-like RCC1 family protein
VDSNLAVPGQLNQIEVAVTAAGKTQRLPYSLSSGYALPLRTALVEGHADVGTVDIVATGLLGTTSVVGQEAIVSFVEGETRLLKLFLAAECVGNPCPDLTKTCTENRACIDKVRPPSSLLPFDPNAKKQNRDGGPDAAGDVGRADSGDVNLVDGPGADVNAEVADAAGVGPDLRADALVFADVLVPLDIPVSSADGGPEAIADGGQDVFTPPVDTIGPADLLGLPDLAVVMDAQSDVFPVDLVDLPIQPDSNPDIALEATPRDAMDTPDLGTADVTGDLDVPAPDAGVLSRVQQVTAGTFHSCALRADQTAACWGMNDQGQSTPAPGKFLQIATGYAYSCGLRLDGSILCWGSSTAGRTSPPAGTFTRVSAGAGHACAVQADGGLVCWGDNSDGQATPPQGSFSAVFAGPARTCGLKIDGTAMCWPSGPGTPPEGPFLELALGESFTCGLKSDRTIACWGGILEPPAGSFAHIAAGNSYACAIADDRPVVCWGDNTYGQTSPPAVTLVQVAPALDHVCGATAAGTIVCWGHTLWGQSSPPTGGLTQVGVGFAHACGLHSDGSITCWGDNYGSGPPPASSFVQLSIGCGLTTAQAILCWPSGANEPAGTFTQVSASGGHGCALASDSTMTCWGPNTYGEATPQPGYFRQVATGAYHSCAIHSDGSAVCWGYNTRGQANAPAGLFAQISVGEVSSCAITPTGAAICWGDNYWNQSAPPTGTFTQISAGKRHTCGLRTDQTISCWGDDTYRRSTPPAGSFKQVSAGEDTTCAVDTLGGEWCWGYRARQPL